MIRRVAFKRAVLAGVAGAAAWEAAARPLAAAGVELFDIVRILGMTALGADAPFWQWWTAGLAMHAAVGAIWAIFYAYFFWSAVELRPVLQGIIFSLLPAMLAGSVMVPQLELMQPEVAGRLGLFASGLGVWGPLTIVLGHLIYGAVLGSLYTRPVGYPVGRRVRFNV
ncbi:MAG: hypothetical protein ACK4S4_04150 [Pyrinomonadaceae bacterium]